MGYFIRYWVYVGLMFMNVIFFLESLGVEHFVSSALPLTGVITVSIMMVRDGR